MDMEVIKGDMVPWLFSYISLNWGCVASLTQISVETGIGKTS